MCFPHFVEKLSNQRAENGGGLCYVIRVMGRRFFICLKAYVRNIVNLYTFMDNYI